MWKLHAAHYYNIWLDLKPTRGHRVVMQTFPGGMHSSMDYAMNDAGLVMCETTLDQTGFNKQGAPLAARIRAAAQYSGTIDEMVAMLERDNNGLSTEEWILGDLKTNEIALFTLGTNAHKLLRSGAEQWIAGAKGFYWSCNNDKDRAVRLETIAALDARPSSVGSFSPSKRDIAWLALHDAWRGKFDADVARQALHSPSLVTSYSVDAKFATADMASRLTTWASFGPPSGHTWNPTDTERARYPDIRPLVCNPWTVLAAASPAAGDDDDYPVVDIRGGHDSDTAAQAKSEPDPSPAPAWRGTLLPKTDADIWLATAFANYERIVALERALRAKSDHRELSDADLDHLGVSLFYYRAIYELGSRAGADTPLAEIHADLRSDSWRQVAAGKGVLLLAALRALAGAEKFDAWMDSFGRAHAGQEVTAAEFQSHLEKASGKSWAPFFDAWLHRPGLARLELGPCETRRSASAWITRVTVRRDKHSPPLAVPITVETANSDATRWASLDDEQRVVEITTSERPEQVTVDRYGLASRGGGGPFTILTCENELDRTLIVYGTLDDEAANREAARVLQMALRSRDQAISAPIKSDTETTPDDLARRHLVLVGGPETNRLAAHFRDRLPVSFGSHSFVVRDLAYANAGTAVLLAAENPLAPRYSLVVVAGLSGAATVQAAGRFDSDNLTYAEVVVLPGGDGEHSFVTPPKSLVRELDDKASAATR